MGLKSVIEYLKNTPVPRIRIVTPTTPKTIAEARQELHRVTKATFERYEQQVARRFAELLPDIKVVLRFGCWPDDGTPCYNVYYDNENRERSRRIIRASMVIEDELKGEFPEFSTRGIDIKYMDSGHMGS